MEETDDTEIDDTEAVMEEAGSAERTRSLTELEHDNNLDVKRDSNQLHDAFRQGPSASTLQLRLISEQPRLLSQQDDTWEGWLPLHNAARWGTLRSVAEAAVAACAGAAKTCSKGGYEPLHLAAMGGHLGVCEAIVAAYPEGVLKRDNNGRTPLEEAREGGHEEILLLFRALPGVLEAEEAEAESRARSTRSEFLLEPPGTAASSDEEDVEEEAPARSLASRMFHASLGALWRSSGAEQEQTREAATRVQLARFFAERARWIPLRLAPSERRVLRLLEGVLHVSQYTDRIDTPSLREAPAKRRQAQLRELHALLSGLLLACDYEAGQASLESHNYSDYSDFFQSLFEVTRRWKIMNPEKLRGAYGKLVYLLQDANQPEVQEELGFSAVIPVRTVYTKLDECGALDLLQDEQISVAVQVITNTPEKRKSRQELQREIRQKEAAVNYLARTYSNRKLPPEDLKQCLYSIADNNAYLYQARDPVDRMLGYLSDIFAADEPPSEELSLAIALGEHGARLTHDHRRQYGYVQQSLTLWRSVANDMFRLWCLAEEDLLRADTPYELRDTGQGLQRVQAAVQTAKAVHALLHGVQTKTAGGWVGSSLIHLGDSNVPNALMFIDKYSQVEHILNPILSTIDALKELHKEPHLGRWMDSSFGGVQRLRNTILCDFFRYAFDGSGADNFFDAGSCIDGRLTSAWNWCSTLPEKPFYMAFKLAGFTTFDGNFQA